MRLAHEIGFPGTDQGHGRRRRTRDARGRQRSGAEERACSKPRPRPRPHSATRGIYLENYIEQPRHVEVQVLADHHGNVVHLWERDCSTQRRHQKLIEESPVAEALRRDARRRCAKRPCGWSRPPATPTPARSSSSSIKHGNFYFIEVNARIQVEHPVTEMVTGIDLIKSQIRVASGEPLPFSQKDIVQRGARHRVPHQRRRPAAELSAFARQDRAARSRRAVSACGSIRTPTPATPSRRITIR